MQQIDARRILPVTGGYNFRDLGSIKTKDHTFIKEHLLIRTDELSQLSDDDLNLLADLNVKTIVDFRTEMERSQSVDKVPSTVKNEVHLDIMAANMNAFMTKIQSGENDYKGLLKHFYTDLITSDNAIAEYQRFFKILQNPENTSVVYHCTAGKDRTGIATALILESLNVDRAIIEYDYLLSNRFLESKYAHYIEQNPALADLFLVNKEYLEHAFEVIEKQYYSTNDYLTDILKVDIDLMKKIYTER